MVIGVLLMPTPLYAQKHKQKSAQQEDKLLEMKFSDVVTQFV